MRVWVNTVELAPAAFSPGSDGAVTFGVLPAPLTFVPVDPTTGGTIPRPGLAVGARVVASYTIDTHTYAGLLAALRLKLPAAYRVAIPDAALGRPWTELEPADEQMEAVLEDIRKILREDPGVHPDFVAVNFTDYNDSSLDIQMTYFTADPDFRKHLAVRERINLQIMRAVIARGLSFAFPTQTLHVEDDVARKLAGVKPAVLS